jgi:hypothetical protein
LTVPRDTSAARLRRNCSAVVLSSGIEAWPGRPLGAVDAIPWGYGRVSLIFNNISARRRRIM